MINFLKNRRYKSFQQRKDPSIITSLDTLLIIDMQEYFLSVISEKEKTKIGYLEEKIKEAQKNKAPVFLIEVQSRAPTIEPLRTEPYYQIRKYFDNAFQSTSLASELNILTPELIHTLGCYGEYCVKDTIFDGYDRKFPMIAHKNGILFFSENQKKNIFKEYKEKGIPLI